MRTSTSPSSREEKKKEFYRKVFQLTSQSGYVNCHFCKTSIWAPNGMSTKYIVSTVSLTVTKTFSDLLTLTCSFLSGKHHIEKCSVLKTARLTAKRNDIKLVMVGGIDIDEDLLNNVSLPTPKPAKIHGFVMSSSVLLTDPSRAPSGMSTNTRQRTGRKGYTRCLKCNAETYGPNTSRHVCRGKQGYRKKTFRKNA